MLQTTPGISASNFVIRASFVIGYFVIRHLLAGESDLQGKRKGCPPGADEQPFCSEDKRC